MRCYFMGAQIIMGKYNTALAHETIMFQKQFTVVLSFVHFLFTRLLVPYFVFHLWKIGKNIIFKETNSFPFWPNDSRDISLIIFLGPLSPKIMIQAYHVIIDKSLQCWLLCRPANMYCHTTPRCKFFIVKFGSYLGRQVSS